VNERPPNSIVLGDMTVVGLPPARLTAALAILAEHFHETAKQIMWRSPPNKSKESCILCAAAVRDFLFRAGWRDAELRPVVFACIAERDGELLHSLGIGNPKGPDPAIVHRWDGHAVVLAGGWLIDPTLYQAKRPAWPSLPGMIAAPLSEPGHTFWGLPMLTGFECADPENGAVVAMGWLDQPHNRKWKQAPDYQRRRYWQTIASVLLGYFQKADKEAANG